MSHEVRCPKPECGAMNRAEATACAQCGTPLGPSEVNEDRDVVPGAVFIGFVVLLVIGVLWLAGLFG